MVTSFSDSSMPQQMPSVACFYMFFFKDVPAVQHWWRSALDITVFRRL
jgi:hypothetical protein